jgi:hypothetical protein
MLKVSLQELYLLKSKFEVKYKQKLFLTALPLILRKQFSQDTIQKTHKYSHYKAYETKYYNN